MADWNVIQDTQVDPDAPITSELGYAFRDNPIAIAEGASGAPRIEDAALSGSATGAGRTWIVERMAIGGQANVGNYVFARFFSGTHAAANPGDIASGDDLRYVSSNSSAPGPSLPSGSTWRCHGYIPADDNAGTLWQRRS